MQTPITHENEEQVAPQAPSENATEVVCEGLRLLTLSTNKQNEIVAHFSKNITASTVRLHKFEPVNLRVTAAVRKEVAGIFLLTAKAIDFAATRLSFELENTKSAISLLEDYGPFLSDWMDSSTDQSRAEVNDLTAQAESVGLSLDGLIQHIQEYSASIEEMGANSEGIEIYGATLSSSTLRFNNVLDDMITLYNMNWFAFKDIVDGLKVSMNQETFVKPDLESPKANAEELTEEEWEALEDAEDLAIAKERYASMDRSQLIPAGMARSIEEGSLA